MAKALQLAELAKGLVWGFKVNDGSVYDYPINDGWLANPVITNLGSGADATAIDFQEVDWNAV